MKIFQNVTLSADPVQSMDAVTKQYVDNTVSSGVITGGVFFTDISPTSAGIVGNKQYVSNTVPANKVITNGTADTNTVRVTVFAEGGGAFYSPVITITTVPAQSGGPITATLSEDPSDKRAYTGYADLVGVTSNTVVTAKSSTNGVATATILRAAAGPVFSTLVIGTLPNGQTEAKSGDQVTVTGRVSNDAVAAELINFGANTLVTALTVGAADSSTTGYKTITGTFTVSSATGAQNIEARSKNTLGTYGNTLVSSNQITLNQTYPVIGARTIVYPATQSAIKGSESATISSTITSADTVLYTGTDISIANSGVYAASKTVTRISGTYSYGVNNYTITATKTSNGAVTVASSAVTIANASPTAVITIGGSPARLRSSASGLDYVITVTATQRLNVAPDITASAGTWQGTWVGSGGTWTRSLRILDSDAKGSQSFTAILTNLANVIGSIITSGSTYTIGGFQLRTVTFSAFERYHAIGTSVSDVTKLSASYTGAAVLTFYADTASHFQGFSIVDSSGVYSPTGSYLFISDEAFAGANTTGTLQLDIAEAA